MHKELNEFEKAAEAVEKALKDKHYSILKNAIKLSCTKQEVAVLFSVYGLKAEDYYKNDKERVLKLLDVADPGISITYNAKTYLITEKQIG